VRRLLASLAVAAALVAGCRSNDYKALTAAPPGLTANLDDGDKSIRLSVGVALGFECFVSGGQDPCRGGASAPTPETARIFAADLDTVSDDVPVAGPQTRSAFVVVGIAPGKADVTAAGETLSVTVLPIDM
jgi:hypothetical protein